MQRTLTIVGFIILFAVGVATLAGGVGASRGSYVLPDDPVAALILLGSIVGVVVVTIATGFGLAQGLKVLSNQVNAKHSADDRPEIEKRAVSLLEKVGDTAGKALSKIGYGDSSPIAPYTPGYSYKAHPENAEARQFAIGIVIVLALLFGYAIVTHWETWLNQIQSLEPLVWVVGGGSVAAIVALTVGMGVGLAFWFIRTHEEKDKAAKLTAPAWPAVEIAEMEQRIKNAPQAIKQITLLDATLITLNVGLAAILLGAIAIWVVPGMITVFEVDRALNPTPVPVAEVVISVPQDVREEFEALPPGNAQAGQAAFSALTPPCVQCHNVDKPDIIIGPSLQGIATRAATRKSGYPPEYYIYESITRPSDFVPEGFTDGLMPPNFKDVLTEQQIADLIAYLMTLE
ncbi:MAG TPA: c-type cytochrome [Anaerolineales bacterium]|nr:c-type cytochrome [Anaerolineales bacterium]